MKISYSQILALCVFQGSGVAAFTGLGSVKSAKLSTALYESAAAPTGEKASWDLPGVSAGGPSGVVRCEGNSRKSFGFNDLSKDTIQVAMKTEGRPLDATVEVWIGPDWTPYELKCFSDDGRQFPVQTLVGTRNKEAELELRNTAPYEMPFTVACSYAKAPLADIRKKIPQTEEKRTVQGGGSVYSIPLPAGMKQARVFLTTDTKQLNAKVELLNGPNNIKQAFKIFTNNGVLNSFYCVFETPGAGNTIRITNLAPMEFPSYAYVAPIN